MLSAYNTDFTVQDLFHQQVDDTPEDIAVIFEETSLSYRELNEKANCLANFLLSFGNLRDKPVGFCLQRSEDIMITVLGILKAGGAFMPLDPKAPEPRLKSILGNSGSSIVISQAVLKEKFRNFGCKLILIEESSKEIYSQSHRNPDVLTSPNNLAYVIHTSGSTGEPKGVALEHEPLVNLLLWHKHILGDGGQKTLGFMPFTFDVSVQEFFSTCCSGGSYHLTSDQIRTFPEKLVDYVLEQEIERIFMPFTPLQYFIKAIEDKKIHLKSLKCIMNVGEPLVVTQVFKDFFIRHPHCKFRNQYGPTETYIMVTDYELSGHPNQWPERPPIGKPIPNTTLYILNERLEPVAEGKQGEIFIGGICPARGYLNRPDLTKDKFLMDSFSKSSEARMYRTGDLALALKNGNIQCLGREDTQIKIRGFRVELGEIQTVLMQHPGIKLAVAKVFELEPGKQQLVAYFEHNVGQIPSVFELRTFLGAQLPDYMIPHAFVRLEKFPQTASGKLDRNALSAPSTYVCHTEYVPPRTETEKILVAHWTQMLQFDKIGINDNFFVLGGDSIVAAQILLKIEEYFDVELSLVCFFEAQTIATLSTMIDLKLERQKQKRDLILAQFLGEIEDMSEEEVSAQLSNFEQ